MRRLVLVLSLLAPAAAWPYAVEVHSLVTQQALSQAGLAEPAVAPDPAAEGGYLPDRVRLSVDARARGMDVGWAERWATAADFDPWAWKELLLLAPEEQIQGIDTLEPAGATLLDWMARGSRQPDDDYRNRGRYAYDERRARLLDASGAPVPADPALLNMGRLESLSSQAHAHYGLPDIEFSDDPDVLKEDPRRFAAAAGYPPGPILTLAPEMAQLHMDLALLAGLSDDPGAATLSAAYAGQGLHYVQDVGNPIHTVQVGLYDFFVDAFVARLKRGLLTGGGYLGEMRSLASIGIDILTNHHTISEELARKRLVEASEGEGTAEAQRILAAMREDDPELSARIDEALAALGPAPTEGEFARAIVEALIELSSHEGDDMYRATRAIAKPEWRADGALYDWETMDPDDAVLAPSEATAADYEAFWALQERSFRRAGTAVRRYEALRQQALAQAAASPEAREALKAQVEERLVRRQLAMLADAEARRAEYLANPPVSTSAPERVPAILAAEVGVLALLVGVPLLLIRRRRRQGGGTTS